MLVCLKKPNVGGSPAPNARYNAGVAVVTRQLEDSSSGAGSSTANAEQNGGMESIGFGDLPLHVLDTLMAHVLQLGDTDTVRTCRLVCKAWNSSVAVNVTAVVLRPMTRFGQDISRDGRPIINHAADGLRAPPQKSYISMTVDILESEYSVFVPEPVVEEVEQPVTRDDAQQAEDKAQSLWSRMQAAAGGELVLPRHDSIGHYPFEDSSYSGSVMHDDGDDDVLASFNDVKLKDSESVDSLTDTLPAYTGACTSHQPEELRPSCGVGISVNLEAVNRLHPSFQVSSFEDIQQIISSVDGREHEPSNHHPVVESTNVAANASAAHATRQRRWFRRGSSSTGEEQSQTVAREGGSRRMQDQPPKRSWLRHVLPHLDEPHPSLTSDAQSEVASGDSEIVESTRGGSSRRCWFRHTRGGSDLSDDLRSGSFAQIEVEESNVSSGGKVPSARDGASPTLSSGKSFPRLKGWLRGGRGAAPDGDEALGDSLEGISSANLRSALQSADGAVITVQNEELDAFAKELRQQFVEGERDLPRVVLHVGTDSVELYTPATSASGSTPVRRLMFPDGTGGGRIRRLRQLISRSNSHGGESTPQAASDSGVTEGTSRRRPAASYAAPSSVTTSAAEAEVLNKRQQQVIQFLAKVEEGGDVALEELPVGDCKSESASDMDSGSGDDLDKYPTNRCRFMLAPTEQPAASTHRRQIIAAKYHYTNTCNVDLKLLHQFRNLQALALPLATKNVDPADLARLTQLTCLNISMRRRNHLGLGKRLQFLPPPANFNGIWQAIEKLKELRSLNLSHSVGMSERQIARVTALTNLESLDLTGVQLPISTLRTFACLTCLTQLRIPNVMIVSENFMQLIGEGRDAPRLVEMLEAMPQLRHLDLYTVEHGENQTILKDPKHMRTLAHATQLQRLDIAKLGQVTDSSLALLQGLTSVTALKIGCNTFDIYPITGRAFIMFRTWEYLRVLYIEACRFLQKDAFIALACSCPHLQVLHMDTASRVTPAAFALTPMMPDLRVLELVSMKLVPNAKITEVCAGLHHLRPGMADHIITLKKFGTQNLGKFGEAVRGGFLGAMLAY